MAGLAVTFPGNVFFTGTVTSPQFVSNQAIVAVAAAGTMSTITSGSIASTFLNAATLSAIAGTLGSLTFGTYVGINTATPGYPLDVAGDINFSGTFRQNGSPYIGSQWTTTGTNLSYTAGNVGISTSSPAFSLDVNGSSRVTGTFLAKQYLGQTTTQAANDTLSIGPVGGNVFLDRTGTVSGAFIFNYNTPLTGANATNFQVYNGSTNRAMLFGIVSAGTVSGSNYGFFGTSLSVGSSAAPAYTLDVTGTARVSSTLYLNSGGQVAGNNGLLFNTNSNITSQGASSAADLCFWSNGGYGMRILPTTGYVGIGGNTTVATSLNPAYPLDVVGQARVSSTLNIGGNTGNYNSGFLSFAYTGSASTSNYLWLGCQNGGYVSMAGTGYVGIGTGTPAYALDVTGDTHTTGNFRTDTGHITSNTTNGLVLDTAPGTQITMRALTAAGNVSGFTDIAYFSTASVQLRATSTIFNATSANYPIYATGSGTNSELKFMGNFAAHYSIFNTGGVFSIANTSSSGTPPSSAGTSVITINSSNFVGITNTSPAYPLDVTGAGRISGGLYLNTMYGTSLVHAPALDTTSYNNYIRIRNTGTGDGSPNWLYLGVTTPLYTGVAKIDTDKAGVASATPLSLCSMGVEAIRLISSGTLGFVGINNTNPAYNLDVSGSTRITGSLTASSISASLVSAAPFQSTIYPLYAYNTTSTPSQIIRTNGGTQTGVLFSVNNAGASDAVGYHKGALLFTGQPASSGIASSIQLCCNTLSDSSNATAANAVITVTGTGLGVLTTTPQTALDVTGSARVTGSLTVSGNLSAANVSASNVATYATSFRVGFFNQSPGATLTQSFTPTFNHVYHLICGGFDDGSGVMDLTSGLGMWILNVISTGQYRVTLIASDGDFTVSLSAYNTFTFTLNISTGPYARGYHFRLLDLGGF